MAPPDGEISSPDITANAAATVSLNSIIQSTCSRDD